MDELFAEAVRVIAQEHGLDAGPILQALGPRAKALLEADDWDALEAAVQAEVERRERQVRAG